MADKLNDLVNERKPIKLKHISVLLDYANKRRLAVDFSDCKVSVIYGENGCGKTTMLKLFNAFLSQDEGTFLQEKVIEYNIIYLVDGEEKTISVKQEVREEEITDDDGRSFVQNVICYNWEEFRNSEMMNRRCVLFGVNRGISKPNVVSKEILYNSIVRTSYARMFSSRAEVLKFCSELKARLDSIQRYGGGRHIKTVFDLSEPNLVINEITMETIEELLVERYRRAKIMSINKVQKALFDTIADLCDSNSKNITLNIEDAEYRELLMKNKDRLISALMSGEKNPLSIRIIESLKRIDMNDDNCSDEENPLLKNLIVNMSNELNNESEMIQTINHLREIFNDYIGPEKYIDISEEGVQILFKGTNDFHGLNQLSSGEKHLLVLLTIFVIEGDNRDFFIVDEPEISLNMEWQRKLLPLLSELAPEAEIIVASHSPSIAKVNPNYLTELRR